MKAKLRVIILLVSSLSLIIPQNNDQLKTNVKTIEEANLISAGEKTTEWDLVKDKDGIKVYTREVAGSPLKEYRGVVQVRTSLESLIALYYDPEACSEWIHNCKSAKVLKELSPTEKYIYSENEAPWPVSNRDLVFRAVITQNPDSKEVLITEEGVPNYIPENSCCIRIPEMKSYWKFTPLSSGVVEVTWQSHSNPGGRLPNFLVNSVVVDMPFETLSKMKEIVQRKKYQQSKLSFLK